MIPTRNELGMNWVVETVFLVVCSNLMTDKI